MVAVSIVVALFVRRQSVLGFVLNDASTGGNHTSMCELG